MRLLHTSDWHLGRTLFAVPLIDHQRAFLEWLVDEIRADPVDAVLICGDVYDRAVPSVEAVALFEWALVELARITEVVLIPGNHDSAARLGFAGPLLEAAHVHVRANVDGIERPVRITDALDQSVEVFAIPYLEPAFQAERLDCERSHEAVLGAAMDRIRASSAQRDSAPMVVVAHAFVTGGLGSDSERDVRVGGIADAPVSVFDGAAYVALGHLHRPQAIGAGEATPCRYSGSPLAYSFSEEGQVKSVTIIEIAPDGTIAIELLATPVPRRMTTIRGLLADLLADPSLDACSDDWIRAVITDARRPERPMDRLRERFPHTLQLEFEPDGGVLATGAPTADVRAMDPVEVVGQFLEHVTGTPVTEAESTLIASAVERTRLRMVQ